MTPTQAKEGVLELGLPNGESVLVTIADDVPGRPDVDAEVIEAMLAADEGETDVGRTVSRAVAPRGLKAHISDDRHPTTVIVAVATKR